MTNSYHGWLHQQATFPYFADANPIDLHLRLLHSDKATVCCGVSKLGRIGPCVFSNGREQAVTINSERCGRKIDQFLTPQLEENDYDMNSMWFQEYGATAHTARISLQAVCMFLGHVISLDGDVSWHTRSPDLTVCELFL